MKMPTMDHNVWRGTNLTITKGIREEGDSAFFESLDRQCPTGFNLWVLCFSQVK